MTSSYFDPTYSKAPGGWSLPEEAYPTWKPDPGKEFDWTTQEKSPNLFENALDNLGKSIGSNLRGYTGVGEKREGDTYIRPPGATVADLGGGNTLYVPDTTTQMRMAQAGQQGTSGGGFGRMAGSILGQAGGAALGAKVGGVFGSALGPLGAVAGAGLGSLLPF